MSGTQTVFGGASLQHESKFSDTATLIKVYAALDIAGCHIIDTASIYGASEEIIGTSGASKRFTIDTKAPGSIIPGSMTTQGVQSFAHRTLAGVNEAYKEGCFRRFGLSNFLPEDVQRIYDICKREGYPLPSVYQGDFSAIARKPEEVLIHTLRKLGIKTILEALEKWTAVAEQEGTTKADLAYRWVKYNSILRPEHGDTIITGATSLEQLEHTLSGMEKGPVNQAAARAIDEIWEGVKD